jgi:hypothetical protein
MVVRTKQGQQGRTRGRRSGAQVGSGSSPGSPAGDGNTIVGQWIHTSGVTLQSAGVVQSWTSSDSAAKVANLYSTLSSYADPRPLTNARGIYFNGQSGLQVASGLLPMTQGMGLIYAFDLNIAPTSYTTKTLMNAASGSEGDTARVTADTNTTYSPDVTLLYQSGFPDADLVNGYYIRNYDSTWTNPTLRPIWGFANADASHYLKCFLTRLGQILIQAYDGTNSFMMQTVGTDVLAGAGTQNLGLFHDGLDYRLFLNGKEIHAIKSSVNITDLSVFYFNGSGRIASASFPVNGWRHYVKALTVIDRSTWANFVSNYNSVATATSTTALDIPSVAWGLLASGQSWWQGSTDTSSDTWTTAGGWNGMITAESPGKSGDLLSLTREPFPHVYCTQDDLNNNDIGPLCLDLNGLGNVNAANSHRSGSYENFAFGGAKQLISYVNATSLDWLISSAGGGGYSLALSAARSVPPVAISALRSTAAVDLTEYERLLQAVCFAKDFAAARGQSYKVKAWHWQQGHTDALNTSYATQFISFYDQLVTDVKTITGQTEDVICLIPQINWSDNGTRNRAIIVDQQILDIIDGRGSRPIYCTGPVYQITNFIHSYRAGYRWIGELFGKIAKQVVFDGLDWNPVRPLSFTKGASGASYVDIVFHVPVGPLQFATNSNNVASSLTAKGFEYSGGGRTISSVAVQASDTIRINLSGAPQNGDTINYVVGQRYGNLVDSDTATAYYKDQDWTQPLVSGSPVYKEGSLSDLRNWACAFTYTFPGAAPGGTTWDPANKGTDIVLFNSNRSMYNPSAGWESVRSTTSKSSGKWYSEFVIVVNGNLLIGLADASASMNSYLGNSANSMGEAMNGGQFLNGFTAGGGSGVTGFTTDVIQMAIDFDAGEVRYGKNGSLSSGGSPRATFTPNWTLFLAASDLSNSSTNFSLPATTVYSAPAGYSVWNG